MPSAGRTQPVTQHHYVIREKPVPAPNRCNLGVRPWMQNEPGSERAGQTVRLIMDRSCLKEQRASHSLISCKQISEVYTQNLESTGFSYCVKHNETRNLKKFMKDFPKICVFIQKILYRLLRNSNIHYFLPYFVPNFPPDYNKCHVVSSRVSLSL